MYGCVSIEARLRMPNSKKYCHSYCQKNKQVLQIVKDQRT